MGAFQIRDPDSAVAILATIFFPRCYRCGCSLVHAWPSFPCGKRGKIPMDGSIHGEFEQDGFDLALVPYVRPPVTPVSSVPSPTSHLDSENREGLVAGGDTPQGLAFAPITPGKGVHPDQKCFFMTTCQVEGCDATLMRQPSKPPSWLFCFCWSPNYKSSWFWKVYICIYVYI